MQEQRNKGRARVKIAVFLVLTIHGVGLMALLMQGCKKEGDTSANVTTADATNMPAPAFPEPTNAPATDTNLAVASSNAIPVSPPVEPGAPPVTAPASDYVIVKGDTFSTIAKKFHVSVKGLLEANPAVEPTKLKIGQSIHIPAVSAGSPALGGAASPSDSMAGQTYTVKSGDSLTKIASQFGVGVKALRSANSLKTDKIVVGQKLKIPGKATTTASTTGSTSAPASNATGQ